jgi:hypothetical protein
MKPIQLIVTASLFTFFIGSTSFAAVEGEQPGNVMPDATGGAVPPKKSTIPAVPEGKNLKAAENHPMLHKTVKSPQGQQIGTIDKLLTSKDGRIEYAEVSLAETNTLVPVPWTAFRSEGDSLIINATREQLQKQGPTFQGGQSGDFEHKGGEPLKPNLRQGGG